MSNSGAHTELRTEHFIYSNPINQVQMLNFRLLFTCSVDWTNNR